MTGIVGKAICQLSQGQRSAENFCSRPANAAGVSSATAVGISVPFALKGRQIEWARVDSSTPASRSISHPIADSLNAHTGPRMWASSGRPPLRNIAVTAPYMHDGSLPTLEEVLDHYAAGGKFDHPNKSRTLRPFRLTEGERRDLIEFLNRSPMSNCFTIHGGATLGLPCGTSPFCGMTSVDSTAEGL